MHAMLTLGEYHLQWKFFCSANLLKSTFQTRLHWPSVGVARPGSRARKLRARVFLSNQKRDAKSLIEVGDVDCSSDDSDGEEEDDVFVPLRSMKEWLGNKPRGFGEGEVYDTSIEDQLIEEIGQSRRTQLVKLKNNHKQFHQEEASKHVRVRLINLPKKRNVDRDLRSAFKGFPGIISINPIVSGKAKTRDPTCKGIAFIDFKSEDGAHRFVQAFSGKSIDFGKIQKHIKCVMMSSNPSKNVQLPDETRYSDLMEADLGEEVSRRFVGTTSPGDDELKSATAGVGGGGSSSSSFSDVQKKTEANEKKKKAMMMKVERKKKSKSLGNSNILGSAKRLKIREKTQLAGVLFKYGSK